MNKILSIENLKVYFDVENNSISNIFSKKDLKVRAVDGVDLSVNLGETTGLIGESGSGKSTLGLAIVGLNRITSGKIYFENNDISNLYTQNSRKFGKYIQMVFQDPFSSLNPCMTFREILYRQLRLSFKDITKMEIKENINNIIKKLGFQKTDLKKYPHEFSGGQKQRICIARAILPNPELLIADEVTSALDVSVQSQILDVLLKLKENTNLSIIYITHDLRVAKFITDFIAVMYLGKIIEFGKTTEIYKNPLHPYTKALLSSIPRSKNINKIKLKEVITSSMYFPQGCRLYSRCPFSKKICNDVYPDFKYLFEDHKVACHLY